MRRGLIGALLLVAALLTAAAAYAGGHEQIKYTAADQAAARAATIKRADLTGATGWTGGTTKPDISAPPSCPNHPVDLSKYVLTGAAASQFRAGTRAVASQIELLKTVQMVNAEWKLQVTSPGALACLRSSLAKTVAAGGARLVSFAKVSFPRLTAQTLALRIVLEGQVQGVTLRQVVEEVLVGKGRTEIELTVSDLASAQSAVAADAVHYARILVGRVKS
jgi:hypothetical protein